MRDTDNMEGIKQTPPGAAEWRSNVKVAVADRPRNEQEFVVPGDTFNAVMAQIERAMNPDNANTSEFRFRSNEARRKMQVNEEIMVDMMEAVAFRGTQMNMLHRSPAGDLARSIHDGIVDGYRSRSGKTFHESIEELSSRQNKVITEVAQTLTDMHFEAATEPFTSVNPVVEMVARKLAVITMGQPIPREELARHAKLLAGDLLSLHTPVQEMGDIRIDRLMVSHIAEYAQINFGIQPSEHVQKYLDASATTIYNTMRDRAFHDHMNQSLHEGVIDGVTLATRSHPVEDIAIQKLIQESMDETIKGLSDIRLNSDAGKLAVDMYAKMQKTLKSKVSGWFGRSRLGQHMYDISQTMKLATAGAVKKFVEMQIHYQTLPETANTPESYGLNDLEPIRATASRMAESIMDAAGNGNTKLRSKLKHEAMEVLDDSTYRHHTIDADNMVKAIETKIREVLGVSVDGNMQLIIMHEIATYKDAIAYPPPTVVPEWQANKHAAEAVTKYNAHKRIVRRLQAAVATTALALAIFKAPQAAQAAGREVQSRLQAAKQWREQHQFSISFGADTLASSPQTLTITTEDADAKAATLSPDLPTVTLKQPIIDSVDTMVPNKPDHPTNTPQEETPTSTEDKDKIPGIPYLGKLRLGEVATIDKQFQPDATEVDLHAPEITCNLDMSDVIDPNTGKPWRYAYVGDDGKVEWRNFIEWKLRPSMYLQQRTISPEGGAWHTVLSDRNEDREILIHSWQTAGRQEVGDSIKQLGDGTRGEDPVRTREQLQSILDQVRGKVMSCTQPDGKGSTINQYLMFEMNYINPITLTEYYNGDKTVAEALKETDQFTTPVSSKKDSVLFARTCAVGPIEDRPTKIEELQPRADTYPTKRISAHKLTLLKREQGNYGLTLTKITPQQAQNLEKLRAQRLKEKMHITKEDIVRVLA